MANIAIKTKRSAAAPAPAVIPISAGRFKPCVELLVSVLTESASALMDDADDSELEGVGTHELSVEGLATEISKTTRTRRRYTRKVSIYSVHKGDTGHTSFPED